MKDFVRLETVVYNNAYAFIDYVEIQIEVKQLINNMVNGCIRLE